MIVSNILGFKFIWIDDIQIRTEPRFVSILH